MVNGLQLDSLALQYVSRPGKLEVTSVDKSFLTSILLYTAPLAFPLFDVLGTWYQGASKETLAYLEEKTPNASTRRLCHKTRDFLIGVQLVLSIGSSAYHDSNAWDSFRHIYWLIVLLLSVARHKLYLRHSHVTFLCIFPFVDSVINTILPLFALPIQFSARDAYLSAALQSVLLLIPLFTPRAWSPVDPNTDEVPSPEQTCSPFSYYISYQWVEYLIRIALHRNIVAEDLPPLPDYDHAWIWKARILEARRESLLWTILVLMRWEVFLMSCLAFAVSMTQFLSPLAMQQLLQYLDNTRDAKTNPYLWAILLLIGPISWAISREAYIFVSTRLVVRMKAALTQLIYMKVMVMKASDGSEETSAGRISNLMSADIATITMAREFFLLIVQLPLCTIMSLLLLYNLMGYAVLVGFAGLLITLPVPGFLAKYMALFQRAASLATDRRLSSISENLHSMRITKLFGWEQAKVEEIDSLRTDEQGRLWARNFVSICIGIVTDVLPALNMFLTFLVYTLIMDRALTASVAFTSIAYFEILRSQFLWVGFMSRNLIQCQVALKRIESFLNDAEELPMSSLSRENKNQFSHVSCTWSIDRFTPSFQLKNLNIKFERGLNIIIGATASGKSSLLMALLGEMAITSGEVCLNRQDGVAFVSQTAWLQATTIRDNILFGLPLVAARYGKVIKACALEDDFKLFEFGDETEVGESGASLSGGQKQRIALARALYSEAQTLILDDVLSALDGSTGEKVFRSAITGSLTKNKTVIMVTHAVGLCSPKADQIITLHNGMATIRRRESVMNLHKRAASDAASVLLLSTGSVTKQGLQRLDSHLSKVDVQLSNTVRGHNPVRAKSNRDEKSAEGRISRTAALSLAKDFGSPLFLAGLVLAQLAYQSLTVGAALFPGLWADAYEQQSHGINVGRYLGIYAAIILSQSLMNGICNAFVYHGNWVAAGRLHKRLLKSVFGTPLAWHEKTPVGRVVNRFARDIQSLDTTITPWIRMSLDGFVKVIFSAVSVATILPLFAVPAAIVAFAGILVGEAYTKAQIAVKRLVSVTESPLFSHFGDTITGIVTIRAFGAQKRFSHEAETRIDTHTRPSEVLFALTRWTQVRADSLGAIVSFSAALLALIGSHKDSGLIGFSLSVAAGFSMTLLTLVRALNEMEVELNSFERVTEYSSLDQEPVDTEDRVVKGEWPSAGGLVVDNFSASYTSEAPIVLKNVSFKVRAGERIGIVGRSGSGKSTLGMSLLRFTHRAGGSIKLDGRDIEDVNLSTLRQGVTIIPQDPVLFSGTIKSNLDPIGAHTDDVLADALDECGLNNIETVARSDDASSQEGFQGPITLDSPVTDAGGNFSQGQRQLIALARAIVRSSRLVIMDEATASVDAATDARIQQTFRRKFSHGTMLTIAHRLKTICDYDRILVLKEGKVVEFDTSKALLQRQEGLFASMVYGSDEKADLLRIINGN